MGEIVFCGKRKDNGEWIYGDLFQDRDLNQYYIGYFDYYTDGYSIHREYFQHEVMPITIGQFTGLFDKNERKIFEGNIIKSCENDDVYFVKYCADDNYPAFDVVPEINIECNGLSYLHIVEGIEVIGNIHDNAEFV